jgi:hypothetical protein
MTNETAWPGPSGLELIEPPKSTPIIGPDTYQAAIDFIEFPLDTSVQDWTEERRAHLRFQMEHARWIIDRVSSGTLACQPEGFVRFTEKD